MSADNYFECPNCAQREANEVRRALLVAGDNATVRKVLKKTLLSALHDKRDETIRWHTCGGGSFYKDRRTGDVTFSYDAGGTCSVCEWSFSFAVNIPVADLDGATLARASSKPNNFTKETVI